MSGSGSGKLIADGERLVGASVHLRLVEMSDCGERYLRWLSDPRVNRFLETRWAEQTLQTIESFVTSMRESSQDYLFAIVFSETGEHVGNIRLGPVHAVHRWADVGYFIGSPGMWGKGIATEAISLATRFAFDRLGVNRVQAVVDEENVGSARALEKAGFRKEGVLRHKLNRDGGWRDQHVYGILRGELDHGAPG